MYDSRIHDWCFVPILKHEVGPQDTWFLGSTMLDGYYSVFDMNQEPRVYIAPIKNHFIDPWALNYPSEDKEWVKWLRIVGIILMVGGCCHHFMSKKKKQTEITNETTPETNSLI